MPILSRTPARMTEPAVGASTWASGSQVWNGKIGTLMANASAKAANSQGARLPTMPRVGQDVVVGEVEDAALGRD